VVKEKVTPSIEVPEKMKPKLEKFKEVVHDELHWEHGVCVWLDDGGAPINWH